MDEKVTAGRRFRGGLKLVSHLTCMCAFPVSAEALGLAYPSSKEYDKISIKILNPRRAGFRGPKCLSHHTRSWILVVTNKARQDESE